MKARRDLLDEVVYHRVLQLWVGDSDLRSRLVFCWLFVFNSFESVGLLMDLDVDMWPELYRLYHVTGGQDEGLVV